MDAPILPSGSGFNFNHFNGNRIRSCLKDENNKPKTTNYVSLTKWCNQNFISKKQGRNLLEKKLLIGQRLYGQWWVCANLDCLEQLLEYLNVDSLNYDANNY